MTLPSHCQCHRIPAHPLARKTGEVIREIVRRRINTLTLIYSCLCVYLRCLFITPYIHIRLSIQSNPVQSKRYTRTIPYQTVPCLVHIYPILAHIYPDFPSPLSSG